MKKYEDFIKGLQADTRVPDEISQKFHQTLVDLPDISSSGPTKHTKNKLKILTRALASTAAVLALSTGLCLANPVLAAKIPILGQIFQRIEDKTTYSGKFAEKAEIGRAHV